MIDNLLLEARFRAPVPVKVRQRGQYGRVHRRLVPDRRLQRTLEWQRVAGSGFWVGWCEETRAVQLLLSIPRIHNWDRGGNTSNFPLHDFNGIEEMGLTDTAREVLRLLGVLGVARGKDPVKAVLLGDWIVRRIAYAVDVRMEDPGTFLGEVAALPRKRQTQVKVWGRPGRSAHAVQWEAGGVDALKNAQSSCPTCTELLPRDVALIGAYTG